MKFIAVAITLVLTNIQMHSQVQIELTDHEDYKDLSILGENTAWIYHALSDNEIYEVPEVTVNSLSALGNRVFRFPGGAIANYYHYGTIANPLKGYGINKSEVNTVPNRLNCNTGSSSYCFQQDAKAPQNFIENYLRFMVDIKNQTGAKVEVLHVPNLMSHFINDKTQIDLIKGVDSFADLNALKNSGTISQGFFDRINENLIIFSKLKNSPAVEIVGVEYGNEFYFNQVVTNVPYVTTNAIPTALFNLGRQSFLNSMRVGVLQLNDLILMYNSLFREINPSIKFGIPIANFLKTGNMANTDGLWNELVRNIILPNVDAVIPHLYAKPSAFFVDPSLIENPEHADDLAGVKSKLYEYAFEDLPRHIDQAIDYFNLSAKGKKIWVTEWNFENDHGQTFFSDWFNTIYHTAYISAMVQSFHEINQLNDEVVEFSLMHNLLSNKSGFTYGHMAVDVINESEVLRCTYYGMLAMAFASKEFGSVVETSLLQGADNIEFNGRLYLLPFEADALQLEAYYAFTNLTGSPQVLDFSSNNLNLTAFGAPITVKNLEVNTLEGNHINSSCGITAFRSDETYDVIHREYTTSSTSVSIDPYSIGVVKLNLLRSPSTGIKFNELKKPVYIYPNPTSDLVTIDLKEENLKNLDLSIYNILGEQVYHRNFQNFNFHEVSMKDFPPGNYLIRLHGDEINQVVKISRK